MSPIIVLALIFALVIAALAVFVAVVIGIHSEPRFQMTTRAQSPLGVMARRMLGVHVTMPTIAGTADDREECLTGNSTDWSNNGRSGE